MSVIVPSKFSSLCSVSVIAVVVVIEGASNASMDDVAESMFIVLYVAKLVLYNDSADVYVLSVDVTYVWIVGASSGSVVVNKFDNTSALTCVLVLLKSYPYSVSSMPVTTVGKSRYVLASTLNALLYSVCKLVVSVVSWFWSF